MKMIYECIFHSLKNYPGSYSEDMALTICIEELKTLITSEVRNGETRNVETIIERGLYQLLMFSKYKYYHDGRVPFYERDLSLILTWINDFICYRVWYGITYPSKVEPLKFGNAQVT